MAERQALETQFEELALEIEALKLENSVFTKFYEKKKADMVSYDEDEKKKKSSSSRSKKVTPTLLTADQRYEIANSVNEDLHVEIEACKKNSEKMIDTLKAVLEETDIRIGELKRDAYEFKRDVVIGAENPRTGKIMAERATRYFEDKLKSKDVVIEKLRLKNATLKSQLYKIESQLGQKEEVGDVLHYIDFHQLQIENKQYVAKIEERNQELLVMKHSTGKTIVTLNDYKKRLSDKLNECAMLTKEVEDKRVQLEKLKAENKKIRKDVTTGKRTKVRMKQEVEDASEMPHVEDYIEQKKLMYELETSLKNWQKKVGILEMAAQRTRTIVQKAQYGLTRAHSS